MLRAHPHALALATLVTLAPAAAAQARRLELADVGRIVRLGDPQISPDGRTVIVAVSRADLAANAWRTELVAVDVASGAQRVVAPGLRAVGHARWSSRGDRVAFLAAAPGGGRQIYLMPAGGGPPAVLTRSATGVEAFAWRPDGGALAFAAADPRAERAADTDPFEVGNDHYMTSAAPRPSHVWLVPAARGAARRLTKGAWSLTTSISDASLSWAPDGGSIALVQIASASPGDADQGIVVVVDTAGRGRRLTGRAAGEGGARFSPDGSRIAYSYARDGVPANVEEVVVAPAAGGEGESATRGIDRQVGLVDWWPDGQGLLVLGTDGTRAALWSQPLGGAARKLPLGDIAEIAGASVSRSGAIALVASEPARPQELYVIERPGAPPRRLTRFNEGVAKLALGRSERVTWTTHDGMTADGVVTYPPGFDPARKYPLVLHIHGGPTASSNEAFLARAQLLAARGWVVLQPNYRGSDNLGNAFQRAIADDAGEGPGRDVVAGVDALVARGFVDTARVAVSGWSYGGFMTAWLIGRYPERWRAAVAGAAPVDLTDMYALADLNVMRRHAITASPFVGDNLAKYMAMSPITHLSKARAPTLVMSQTADVRVTVTGSYKIFHALKDNGVPVQFVAFPGGGHSPADPVRQLERERRWVEWLERWMQ
ncbi:MAG: prolyl oligopeptidase family serine peptidase [Gemmatimonadaceae bacterium]